MTYAREKIFEPLGIEDYRLTADGEDLGRRLRLSLLPRDMARFGYLYPRRGVWNGWQVVPAAWVEASTHKQVETPGQVAQVEVGQRSGYGYFWFLEDFGGYSSVSPPGEYIFVLPEKDLG